MILQARIFMLVFITGWYLQAGIYGLVFTGWYYRHSGRLLRDAVEAHQSSFPSHTGDTWALDSLTLALLSAADSPVKENIKQRPTLSNTTGKLLHSSLLGKLKTYPANW